MHSSKNLPQNEASSQTSAQQFEQFAKSAYHEMGFSEPGPKSLSYPCFREALIAYTNGALNKEFQRGWFLLVDFDLPITEKRGFFLNFDTMEVLAVHVAHGTGSGTGEFVKSVSDRLGKNQSFRGVVAIGGAHRGRKVLNGLKIHGFEPDNHNADKRHALLHPVEQSKYGPRLSLTRGCIGMDKPAFSFIQEKVSAQRFDEKHTMGKAIKDNGGNGFMGAYIRFTRDGGHQKYVSSSKYLQEGPIENGNWAGVFHQPGDFASGFWAVSP